MAASTAVQVIVSPLLGAVYDKLSSLIQEEVGLLLGVNDELKKLSKTLSTIRDVLEDAEDKQITDKTIYNWLQDLKDAAYDIEDILGDCATEALGPLEHEVITDSTKRTKIQVLSDHISCFCDFKRTKFRHKIAKRIVKLRKKLDEIAEEKLKFSLDLNSTTTSTSRDVESRKNPPRETTSSGLPEQQVYGRDDVKEYLVNLLLNNVNRPEAAGHQHQGVGGDLSICPIFGKGGLGKTTLAQMVHNDDRIVDHFEIRSWVCVSQDFELKTLFKAIIDSSCKDDSTNLDNLDALESRLKQLFKGKRFLLVLDDVWNDNLAKWSRLKSSLTCGAKGSSIIVTTRLETVARLTVLTFPVLRLQILPEEHCLALFNYYAFYGDREADYPNLKAIGEEIVRKCGGVPLAAKVLGSSLCLTREEIKWLFVKDSQIWDLPQTSEDFILPALKLSYKNLPSNLRQCLAYCAIFPKDYKLAKKELICLWMANCFIAPKEQMQLFDVGSEIFDDLVWRSFFQDVKEDKDGNITCKMHDLMHDLACSITANECSTIEVHNPETRLCKSTTRHLTLDFGTTSHNPATINPTALNSKIPSFLRTLFQVRQPLMLSSKVPCLVTFSNFKYLHVLDLSRTDITSLPEFDPDNSNHLRYVDLSWTNISSLPESFCNLVNLQTLKLHYCECLQNLPKDMKKMSNLILLDVSDCPQLKTMPVGLGELIHLQMLPYFYVSPRRMRGYGVGGIEELQRLDHLTGNLTIKAISHVADSLEARNACLEKKHNLHSLALCWSGEENDNTSEQETLAVAEVLKPHQNIRRLSIEDYMGVTFPTWMLNSSCLPNLVELKLMGCLRCEHLPQLGQLPFLKVLEISKLDSIICITADEFYGNHQERNGSLFRSLEELDFSEMYNLEALSISLPIEENAEEVFVFPCLKKLVISSCPQLRAFPDPLPSTLQHFHITFCGALNSLSGGLRHLRSLHTLSIKYCEGLELLPDDFQNLTSLKKLVITGLPLTSLPVVGLQDHTTAGGTLEHLELCRCSELTQLPQWMANLTTSLSLLTISYCTSLKLLPADERMEHLLRSVDTVNIHENDPALEQQIMALRPLRIEVEGHASSSWI